MVLNWDKIVSFNPKPVNKANNADPDLKPHFVASGLGLHCLLMSQSRFYR